MMDRTPKFKTQDNDAAGRKHRETLQDTKAEQDLLDADNKSETKQTGLYRTLKLLHGKRNNQKNKETANGKTIYKPHIWQMINKYKHKFKKK